MDDEESTPRMLASRRLTWPAFAIAAAGFAGGIAETCSDLCNNMITVFGMHLNYTYDRQDAEKADDHFIRIE